MTEKDQVTHFVNDLNALVDRYRSEYDLTYASLVGALHIVTHDLCIEMSEDETED